MLKKLKNTILYRRLEWTLPHRIYIRFHNPGYEASQRVDAAFYQHVIRKGDLVYDIGANFGSKSETFLGLGARVVAAEPDPECCRVLRQRFFFNRSFSLVQNAVGSEVGSLEFYQQQPGSAYNTASQKWRDSAHGEKGVATPVSVTTLSELMRDGGKPDFIKIDVEGFELEVVRGLSSPVAALSLEANLPLFREETICCIEILAGLNPNYRFAFVSGFSAGWVEPSLSECDARRYVERADSYCEMFVVDRSMERAASSHR